MKKSIIPHLTFLFFIGAITLIACTKKDPFVSIPVNKDFADKAMVKVYNSTVSSTRNFMFVDGVRINGNAISFPTAPLFPATSFYSAIPAGNRQVLIKDTLATSTQKAIDFKQDFEAGSNYTIFTFDTITNARSIVVKDILQTPVDSTTRLRFAHLVHSTASVPNVDIWSVKLKKNVFSNIALGAITDFATYQSGQNDTLFVRSTGTSTNLAQLNAFSPTQKRSYTLVFRGSYRATSGTIGRSLISFNNY